MKIGMCVNVGLDKIEFASKCGFDYIEYRFEHLANTSDEEFQKLKDCLKKNNIKCEAVNCFLPGTVKIVSDETDFEEIKQYIEKGMKRGKEVGLEVIVFGSGKARQVPEGAAYSEAVVKITAFLKDVVKPLAERYNITVVIEPLKKQDSNFINTVKEGAIIAEGVQSPNIKALVDFYHMSAEEKDCGNIRDLKGSVYHAHVAEPVTRATPKEGTQEIYREFFAALEYAECKRCSIEASHKDFFAEIKEGLETLRKVSK